MIISRLNGGLGNQMFQYAAGRALAQKHGVELGLDLRIYDGPSQFDFALNHFAISAKVLAGPALPPSRKSNKLRYLIWRSGLIRPYFIDQKRDAFDSKFFEICDDSYLRGYWQSERFFLEAAETIAEDFRITTAPTPENAHMAARIRNVNAISLHIRRGDYISDTMANATHGVCTLDYYERALAHLAATGQNLGEAFVFSDDPAWAHENLRISLPRTIVDINDSDHQYEDMRLMSLCKHNIIANSSFSWWAAWLNRTQDKTVIAPKEWFRDMSKKNPEICPPDWIRI
jgi:hypothetical protein